MASADLWSNRTLEMKHKGRFAARSRRTRQAWAESPKSPLLCRFLGRLDDGSIDALDGRRPRSAKARNRGKLAAAAQQSLWGLYERGTVKPNFWGLFSFIHSFVRREAPFFRPDPGVCGGGAQNLSRTAQ
jgi:hypothetical protein